MRKYTLILIVLLVSCQPTEDPTPGPCSSGSNEITCVDNIGLTPFITTWGPEPNNRFHINIETTHSENPHRPYIILQFICSGSNPVIGNYEPDYENQLTHPINPWFESEGSKYYSEYKYYEILMDTVQANLFEVTSYDTTTKTMGLHYSGHFKNYGVIMTLPSLSIDGYFENITYKE